MFAEVVASQGLQLASQAVIRHIAGDFFAKRPGDPDDDSPDTTTNDRSPAGTRGKGVYTLDDIGKLSDVTFKRELGKIKNPVHAKFAEDADNLKGRLDVDVGGGNERKVDLEFVLKPELDPARGHDGDAGPGSVVARPPDKPGGRWTATVEVSSRLGGGDVKYVVGHELAEVVEIVRRYEGNPRISIEAEHQASMFRPGAPTDAKPSAHDVAAARELDSLFEASRKSAREYANALTQRNTTTGASVPLSVFTRHLENMQRLHRKLAAMGFDDGGDPKARIDVVEKHATDGKDLRGFVEQYLKDPSSQLPDAVASTKHILLKPHSDELRGMGIDEAVSQRLLDRGVPGDDIVKVAKAGGARALALLHDIMVSPQHATSGVSLVEGLAKSNQLDDGVTHTAGLQRFATEHLDVATVLAHLGEEKEQAGAIRGPVVARRSPRSLEETSTAAGRENARARGEQGSHRQCPEAAQVRRTA